MEINQIAPQNVSTGSTADNNVNAEKPLKIIAAKQAESALADKEVSKDNEAIELKIAQDKNMVSMQDMAKELQGLADSLGRSVKFSVNEESGAEVIMVFHKKTKELIRQIPSEEVVEMRDRLSRVFGTLIEEKI
jgi:flagellar protein FlaG